MVLLGGVGVDGFARRSVLMTETGSGHGGVVVCARDDRAIVILTANFEASCAFELFDER